MDSVDDILRKLTDEQIDNLLTTGDEWDFTSTPCSSCGFKIPWSFKFCLFCGVENEHFDPAYLDAEPEDCSLSHWEIISDFEDPNTIQFCSACGLELRAVESFVC